MREPAAIYSTRFVSRRRMQQVGCIVLPINSMNASFFNLDFVFSKKKIVLLRNFYYSREIERDSDPRRAYYKVSWKLSPLKIPNLRLITTRASYKKKRKKEIPPLIEYETVLNRDQLSYLLYISSEISVNNKSSYQFAEKHWIPPDLIERDLGFCAGRFVREREREREREVGPGGSLCRGIFLSPGYHPANKGTCVQIIRIWKVKVADSR